MNRKSTKSYSFEKINNIDKTLLNWSKKERKCRIININIEKGDITTYTVDKKNKEYKKQLCGNKFNILKRPVPWKL